MHFWRLASALLLIPCLGNWLAVVEKAKSQEARLQEELERCSSGSPGLCGEVQEALQAARKIQTLETGVEGTAQWSELLDALEYTPPPGSHDVEAWIGNEPSSELSHEDRRLLVSMALGRDVDDSYFFSDEREDRRLWQGPRIAAGYPWKDKTLLYGWDPGIGSSSKRALLSAMEEIEEKSCVKFKEVAFDYAEGDYVQIMDSEEGCWAGVGRGMRRLNLGTGCRSHQTALHELLHSLGQKHEQSRPDRDHFLDVRYENVPEDKKHNFDKSDNGYTSRPYDYTSIMHYSRFAFSKNPLTQDFVVAWSLNALSKLGLDTEDSTLQPRNGIYNGRIGSSVTMSDGDADQLNDMYQCRRVAVSSAGSVGLGIKLDLEVFNMESILSEDWLQIGTGFESMAVSCNAGFAVTSCGCLQAAGQCRGALVLEAAGGTCLATPTAETRGLQALAICAKLASPHYSVAQLSAEGVEVEQACASNYVLMGCSCSARSGQRCNAFPKNTATCQGLGLDGPVQVQALCLRSLAVLGSSIVIGPSGSESIASCGEIDLVGCHCRGVCQGARAMGRQKNDCKALAVEGGSVESVAICAQLAEYGYTELPTAEYLTGGQVGAVENEPVQSLYCDSAGAWSELLDARGCGALKVQTRTKMEYRCTSSGCAQVELHTAGQASVAVAGTGVAACPAGWVMVKIACQEECKSFEVTCGAPLPDSPWYLSGGTSYSPWFNGQSGSAMGSCGQALAIALECAKSTWQLESSCKLVRLHCRRVALFTDDSQARFGAFDVSLSEPRWSKYISSTGLSETVFELQIIEKKEDSFENSDFLPIQRIQCKGNSCDDLRAQMPTKLGSYRANVDLEGQPSVWTMRFTAREMRCPAGHYVANIRCHESYCAEKELLCAIPGKNWLVTGRYYSHCFTNKGRISWADWVRDKLYDSQTGSRSCAGLQPSEMPDSQSCGQDGVLIGLKCYGDECDRIQLVCGSVDAELSNATSALEERRGELKALGLYEDMSNWPSKPTSSRPSTWIWNGQELRSESHMVSESRRWAFGPYALVTIFLCEVSWWST